MEDSKEYELAQIQKKISLTSIIETPGVAMVGLGLYGKFGANGDAFHPLLNDMDIVNGMLVVGGIIMVWGAARVMSLLKEQRRLCPDVGKA